MSRCTSLFAVVCSLFMAVGAHAQEDWETSPFHRPGFYAGFAGVLAFEQGLQETLEESVGSAVDIYNSKRGIGVTNGGFNPSAAIKKFRVSSSESVGINARIGYRLRPYLAAEFQVDYIPPFETEVIITNVSAIAKGNVKAGTATVLETFNSSQQMTTAMAVLKILLPLGRVQPYAVGGGGIVHARTTGSYLSHCTQEQFCKEDTSIHGPVPNDVSGGALADGFDFGFRAGGGVDLYMTEHLVLFWEGSAVIPVGKLNNLNYFSFAWGAQYRF
jgi:Outer membrane protein beta-barrel domain